MALNNSLNSNPNVIDFYGHAKGVTSIAWSPCGKKFASGSVDLTIRIWNIESNSCMNILHGHTREVNSVCWSPDGKKIVSGSGDSSVRVWDAESGQCITTLQGRAGSVYAVSWKPCGKGNQKILFNNRNLVKIWTLPPLQNGGKKNKVKNKITTKKDKSNKPKKLIDTLKKSELVKIAKMHSLSLKTRDDKVKTKLQLYNSLKRKKLI